MEDNASIIEEIQHLKVKIKLIKKHGQLNKLEYAYNIYNYYTNKWDYGSMQRNSLLRHKEILKILHEDLEKLNK